MYKYFIINLVWTALLSVNSVYCYQVSLRDNGPIVKGGKITLTATLYNDEGGIAGGSFKYVWQDNAIPSHYAETQSTLGVSSWVVHYNASVYAQGPYVAQVVVCRYILFYCQDVASNRITFNITATFNGKLSLYQHNMTRNDNFIASNTMVNHTVQIKETDIDFLKNATSVLSHWFIDCVYHGNTTDLYFLHNYTRPDKNHLVEVLVVADFTPLPPPITTTPAPNVTTTTPKPTTTTKATTTVTTTKHPVKREVTTIKPQNSTAPVSNIKIQVNNTLIPYNESFLYVCGNHDPNINPLKTYGYFMKKIQIKAAVSNVNVTGNNWLQHGDLLTLNVKCQASETVRYCVDFRKGLYNVTGNETCYNPYKLEGCEFTIQRYLTESTEYTIVIIIENEISKKVTPVRVTVYKVKKQAQLSVIVVPVAFSLVAVVLIVFGIAYYLQNRSRFVIEVADFNFGQNYSDMEYKTFKERLRDSISNALFTKPPSPGSSDVPVWPPGRRYGSMVD